LQLFNHTFNLRAVKLLANPNSETRNLIHKCSPKSYSI
jgi:hypothetical protein